MLDRAQSDPQLHKQLDESKLLFTATSVTTWGVWKNSLCSEVNGNHTSDCFNRANVQPMSSSLNKERERIETHSMYVTLPNVITR